MDKIQKDREPGLLKYEERKKTLFAAQKWVEKLQRSRHSRHSLRSPHSPLCVCVSVWHYLCLCDTLCVCVALYVSVWQRVWLALHVAFDTSS